MSTKDPEWKCWRWWWRWERQWGFMCDECKVMRRGLTICDCPRRAPTTVMLCFNAMHDLQQMHNNCTPLKWNSFDLYWLHLKWKKCVETPCGPAPRVKDMMRLEVAVWPPGREDNALPSLILHQRFCPVTVSQCHSVTVSESETPPVDRHTLTDTINVCNVPESGIYKKELNICWLPLREKLYQTAVKCSPYSFPL